ncbi:MAG: hypothetical protein K9N40_04650 [Candidatus Cloacimonetes bacterium]|nr:hypothetical protein [Candidatus Cloacimonadota bacterium]
MKKFVLILAIVLLNLLLSAEYQPATFSEIKAKAEAGEALSQAKLADLYIRGTDEVVRNIEKAIPLLQKSYAQNHPFAAYYLGYLALTGVELEKNYTQYFEEAFSGISQMAENNDPEAMLKLSSFYRYGWATDPDPVKADEFLQKAAAAGVPRAIYILGNSYLTGQMTEVNYEKSYQLLSQISETNQEAKYQIANMIFAGLGTKQDQEKGLQMIWEVQAPNLKAVQTTVEGDFLIPNLPPPTYSLAIDEGSCGENVVWTIRQKLKKPISQYEINVAGGMPGRGLHSDEMLVAMNKLQIPYKEISDQFEDQAEDLLSQKYHDFLYEKVIPQVLAENPVMIGVKVYPNRFPQWPYDHFVLLVGYNKNTDELIFNDFNNRRRMPAAKLLNQEPGYSFVNQFNIVFAVVFPEL